MYAVICSPQYWKEIEQAVNSKGEQILFKVIDNKIDTMANIDKIGRISIKHLIIDISSIDDDKIFIQAVMKYRILHDTTQIIIIAPNVKPPNELIHSLVTMGIYDIINPCNDSEDVIILPSLLQVLEYPSPYKRAVKWIIDNNVYISPIQDQDTSFQATSSQADNKKVKVKEEKIIKEVEVVKKVIETPADYKKSVGFIGHGMSGSTSLICWIANYLSKNNVKVAIIDLTTNRDLFEIYPFAYTDAEDIDIVNHSILNNEEGERHIKPFPINKNIDLFTSSISIYNRMDPLIYFSSLDTTEYDVLLVDMDISSAPNEILKYLNTIYVVQTLDVKKLKYNTKFLFDLDKINLKKVKFIINKILECSIKSKDIVECLKIYTNVDTENSEIIIKGKVNSFYIPYDVQCIINSFENTYSFDSLNKDVQSAIQNISNDIYYQNNQGTNKFNFLRKILRK